LPRWLIHRDVNAHNILISVDANTDTNAQTPQYGLVDFGLAVDAVQWMDRSSKNIHGQSQWEFLDVGGDCRYWPTSAWLQFEVGCYDLAKATSLCQEYQTHLDFQGLGITAMQVLAEMMPPLERFQCSEGKTIADASWVSSSNHNWTLPLPQLRWVLASWEAYWVAATRFWTLLLETFRGNGDWNTLKNEFVSLGVHAIISERLKDMRGALAEAERAFRQAPEATGLFDASQLFSALLVMISSGEQRIQATTWKEVHRCFKENIQDGAAVGSSTTSLANRNTSGAVSINDRQSFACAIPDRLQNAGSSEPALLPTVEDQHIPLPNKQATPHSDFLSKFDNLSRKIAELTRDMERLEHSDRQRFPVMAAKYYSPQVRRLEEYMPAVAA